MSNEASTQAETTEASPVDPSTLTSEEAVAFNVHSASSNDKQADILSAWKASQAETGEVDFDAKNVTPEQEAVEEAKEAAKASKKASKEKEKDETVSDDADEDEPEEEVKEASKGKKSKPEKLSQAESRALIEQRVQMNQRFQRRDQQWQAQKQNIEAQLQAKANELEPIAAAIKMFEAGDLDGFAAQLGAITKDPSIKDWTGLNEAAIAAVANPMYRRMRELERQSTERAEETRRQQELYRAQQAEHAKAVEIQNWKASLADEANADEDPAIGNLLTARPQMVDALFAIQQNHYHATGGDLLSARDSAAQLLKNVREDYKFWSNYFEEHSDSDALAELLSDGDQAPKPVQQAGRAARVLERQTTKKTSGAAKAVETKPTPKPNVPKVVKNVSQAQTASASAIRPLNPKQLIDQTIQKMSEEWRANG